MMVLTNVEYFLLLLLNRVQIFDKQQQQKMKI